MTLQLIFLAIMYLLVMLSTFFIGYAIAMRMVLQHLQDKVLPKTGALLEEYKNMRNDPQGTDKLGLIINARMEVTDQLIEVLRPPFSKRK